MTPTYEVIDITPELAAEMLSRNTHNRNIRERTVKTYAADMATGVWRENGETVKVAIDGTILDGQHRLLAIVESNTKQRMMVVRDLPPEAQETIDTGVKRIFADVLRLRGEPDPNNIAATCRQIFLWEQGIRGGHSIATPSTAQLLDVLNRHGDAIRYSSTVAQQVRAHLPIQRSTLALCHFLFDQLDPEGTEVFFDRLKTGAELGATNPVQVLRRTAIDSMTSQRKLDRGIMTAYIIKAWNAWQDGREISYLVYRPGGKSPESFPEPKSVK